jgi:hypothetical protein
VLSSQTLTLFVLNFQLQFETGSEEPRVVKLVCPL